jgi:hypothetical protein
MVHIDSNTIYNLISIRMPINAWSFGVLGLASCCEDHWVNGIRCIIIWTGYPAQIKYNVHPRWANIDIYYQASLCIIGLADWVPSGCPLRVGIRVTCEEPSYYSQYQTCLLSLRISMMALAVLLGWYILLCLVLGNITPRLSFSAEQNKAERNSRTRHDVERSLHQHGSFSWAIYSLSAKA